MTTADEVKKIRVGAVAGNRRRGGDVRITLSPKTVGSTSGFGGVLWLGRGERVAEHYHPYSEEFVHVIDGEVELVVEDRSFALGPGDSLMVPIGKRHRMHNHGEETARLVFHLSPLAPRPDLGHVDLEEPVSPSAAQPEVGA
ncbi:cupin domain-containing protein [Amycolatopsis ultiminotia]|uniref:Cupin domain-containing protein n=1 Tax=Amycolatopsis ultiminotia TaxID=543629 RepID=A0ABP6YNI6_9PSEU